MDIAVVTGASSGMGREFVLALDRKYRFDEIWVAARREDRLLELQDHCRAGIVPLTLDLLDNSSIAEYERKLKEAQPNIRTLVNAAGFGLFGEFGELPYADQLDIITINDRSLTAFTYLSLPFMQKGSQIYNLGSMSSFQPTPYMCVYAASKAFVLSFTRALNVELEPRGIRAMAVCPGWIKTEFFERAVRDDTVSYFNRYYSAQQVIEQALIDMDKGKDVSVLGGPEKRQVWLVKHLPHRLVMRTWCRQQGKK
ncbi:MAG: SDR family NAD(P)-dependent oxidoreductase [Firmicutes bacterium]|nr:SDR family NAD(P)-dependent oxidoreductase [Bacillota bacterium]